MKFNPEALSISRIMSVSFRPLLILILTLLLASRCAMPDDARSELQKMQTIENVKHEYFMIR